MHAPPDSAKIELLVKTLSVLGVAAELPAEPATRDLRRITERLSRSALKPMVETLIVRSLMQAVYQVPNIGHFGLAITEYAHFTSPIRRYPDLVVHRALRAMLNPADRFGLAPPVDALALLGAELTRLEKRADESDRYVDTFLKCSYLRERVGQSFAGLITAVTDFGCFVQLTELLIDGLLRLDQLRDSDWVMAEHGQSWLQSRGRRELKLGAKILVLVTAVNPVEGLIDLDLAPDA